MAPGAEGLGLPLLTGTGADMACPAKETTAEAVSATQVEEVAGQMQLAVMAF